MVAGWVRAAIRYITVVVTVALLLTIGAPLTAPGGSGGFPLGWLTGWLQPVRAWATPADPVLPKQQSGTADGKPHLIPASATRAGAGGPAKAPKLPAVKGQLPDYHPHIGAPLVPDTAPAKGVFDPTTSVRIAKDATARSDTYKNADGSYTRKLYARPVNYKAPDGSWQPIDPKLVPDADGRLRTAANAVT